MMSTRQSIIITKYLTGKICLTFKFTHQYAMYTNLFILCLTNLILQITTEIGYSFSALGGLVLFMKIYFFVSIFHTVLIVCRCTFNYSSICTHICLIFTLVYFCICLLPWLRVTNTYIGVTYCANSCLNMEQFLHTWYMFIDCLFSNTCEYNTIRNIWKYMLHSAKV